MNDPIIESVRKNRELIFKKFNYNLKALYLHEVEQYQIIMKSKKGKLSAVLCADKHKKFKKPV